jgi:hypothetical protein
MSAKDMRGRTMKTLKSRPKVWAVMAVTAVALASTALMSQAEGERQLDPQVWQTIVADAGLDAMIPAPEATANQE